MFIKSYENIWNAFDNIKFNNNSNKMNPFFIRFLSFLMDVEEHIYHTFLFLLNHNETKFIRYIVKLLVSE